MKPTVLVVTPNFPPATGGIETLLASIVTHWQRVDPVVVAPAAPDAAAFDRRQTVPIVRIARGSGPRSTAALLNLAALRHGRRGRPDVVLSGHLVTSPSAWALARSHGTPFVQYVYGREVMRRPKLARFALEHAAASIAISEYTQGLVESVTSRPSEVHRISPCLDADVRTNGGERRPEIVSVARLVERTKGHDVLLEAMPHVLRDVPEARLTVIGDGPLRPELEAASERLGIAASVTFLGAVDDSVRDDALAHASVFALPTRLDDDGGGEGFGIVYLEAAAQGLPSVAGRAGGAVDAVVDGETGMLVDPRDPRAVADAIVALLRDPERARRLGAAAAARVADFRGEVVALQVEDVLLAVAG